MSKIYDFIYPYAQTGYVDNIDPSIFLGIPSKFVIDPLLSNPNIGGHYLIFYILF